MDPLVGYIPGVFDLFHVGHLNALRQARARCDLLVAGVVSDEACEAVKGFRPTVPFAERIEIVDAIGLVDATYGELSTDKLDSWREVGFHVIFKGDDWQGTAKGRALEQSMAGIGVRVHYFPYTLQTSSTARRRALGEAQVS
ncbi:MAG: adenylyltransferase/cytidyltransferase family protein [Nocardioides sp.]|uniref:adenylyltransferase/cytidyltransferase family protein n=1 Tax=Nocardioides sp. TaxID=35761 RepID=UPI0039E29E54